MTTIADLTATMDTVRRQLLDLQLEASRRLADLPDPGADLGALLAELSAAATDRHEHHSVRFPGYHHAHLSCAEDGSAPCEGCADWTRVYGRYESAVFAVTRYALALRERGLRAAPTAEHASAEVRP